MTIRTFWTILIKILGLYIILESLSAIPSSLISLYIFADQAKAMNGADDSKAFIAVAVFYISVIIVYFLAFRYTVFYSDWIIDKLKLDQGFKDDRLELNMHRSTILKIAVIVIGGFLVVDNFPFLCSNLINYFRNANNYKRFIDSPDAKYITVFAIKTFIGYFMLTCSRMIINYIELKQRRPVLENNTEL